jgi:hypothetical protein
MSASANASSSIWHAVHPYVNACAVGGLTATLIVGPEGFIEGCPTAAVLHAAEGSGNRVIRTAAIAYDIASTYRAGAKIEREGPYAYWWAKRVLRRYQR